MSLSQTIATTIIEGHADLTAEARWLSAINAEMLEALKLAYRSARVVHGAQSELCVRLENVIAKAQGGVKS